LSTGSLLLHPADPSTAPDADRVLNALKTTGLAGAPMERIDNAWLAGEQFLQSVTFMGCSPFIELEPAGDDGEDFCFIRLHIFQTPQLIFGRLTRPPKCPHCKKPLLHQPGDIARMLKAGETADLECARCKKPSSARDVLWRRDAGVGRVFVEITSIFPGEAVPVGGFMQQFEQLTGSPWKYFYISR